MIERYMEPVEKIPYPVTVEFTRQDAERARERGRRAHVRQLVPMSLTNVTLPHQIIGGVNSLL